MPFYGSQCTCTAVYLDFLGFAGCGGDTVIRGFSALTLSTVDDEVTFTNTPQCQWCSALKQNVHWRLFFQPKQSNRKLSRHLVHTRKAPAFVRCSIRSQPISYTFVKLAASTNQKCPYKCIKFRRIFVSWWKSYSDRLILPREIWKDKAPAASAILLDLQ